jgi:cellobiose transport system permease protein
VTVIPSELENGAERAMTTTTQTAPLPPPAAKERRRDRRKGHHRFQWWPYLFLLIPILAIFMLEVVPTLGVVWLSFTDYNPLASGSWHSFVGFDNYTRLVSDAKAWQALSLCC